MECFQELRRHRPRRLPLPVRDVDCAVIFARDAEAMHAFYAGVLGFPLHRRIGPLWSEYRVGSCLLAIAASGRRLDAPPSGAFPLHLGLRAASDEVHRCAALLVERGVAIMAGPMHLPWGRRTLFFRDPDGNTLEIHAPL